MATEYHEKGQNDALLLISGSGFRALMLRYDPPKKVIYEDIEIAREGDSETLAQVSKVLSRLVQMTCLTISSTRQTKVGRERYPYRKINATLIRVRMRVDGALHSVAELGKDRYRVIMAALASRGNISTASTEPQSGHMQQEIHRDGASYIFNLRIEAVPTMYGQDVVLRLFNFDTSMLNLDLLALRPDERKQIDEIIFASARSAPAGRSDRFW